MIYEKKQLFRWRQVKRNKQEVHLCTRMLVSGLLVSAATAVFAGAPTTPVLDQVRAGSAVIATGANQTNVDQLSSRVDIDWTSFNTPSGYDVNFFQPSASAVAINRILGAQTQFDGNLNANGQIFLINQNGFIFGASSSLNVGSLLVTTSDTGIGDLAGEELANSYSFSGNNYAQIIQNGTVTFSPGGYAALAAPYIENNGTIQVGWTRNTPTGPFNWTGATRYYQGKTAPLDGGEICETGPNCTIPPWTQPEGFPEFGAYKGRSQIELASATNFELFPGERGSFDSPDVTVGVTFGPTNLITYETQASTLFTDGGEGGLPDISNFPLGVKNTGTLQAESGNIFLRAPLSGKVLITAGQIETIRAGVAGFGAVPDATLITPDGHLVEAGDIHIAGTINADEHSSRVGEGGYIRADARRNIEFDGADIHAIGGNRVAAAFWANGDITSTDTPTTIDLQALDSAEDSTWADADLVMDAGEGIQFNGDITVLASANYDNTGEGYGGGSGSASAEAHARFNARWGDVSITTAATTVKVEAIADNSLSSGRGDAQAGAGIDIDARESVSIEGHTVVNAKATGVDYTWADADQNIQTDGYGGYGGGVTINGDTDITASATRVVNGASASGDVYAYADQYISIGDHWTPGDGGDVSITGDTDVSATARSETDAWKSAYAYANQGIYAGDSRSYEGGNGGSISITGETSVSATAFSQRGDARSYANQYLYAGDADGGSYEYGGGDGGDITIVGNTNLTADSKTGGGSGSTDADVDHYVYAGDGSYYGGDGGDLTITGDLTLKAIADTYSNSDASAEIDQYLVAGDGGYGGYGGYGGNGGDVTITGDTRLTATGTVNSYRGDADADIYQEISAGDGGYGGGDGGDVTITGDLVQVARAEIVDGNSYSDEAYASADLHIYGGDAGYGGANGDITIKGDTELSATAIAKDSYEAEADVHQYLEAGEGNGTRGDVTITGDTLLTATATSGNSNGSYAVADADQDIYADDITITGDTKVSSTATGAPYDGYETSASADVDYNATGDVNIKGDLEVTARADTTLSSYMAPAEAYAYVDIEAGQDGSGSLTFEGDLLVDAQAYSNGGGASASAEADLDAANDVTITTDTTTVEVSATAESEGSGYGGYYGYSVPFAHALLEIEAGDQDVEYEGKRPFPNTGSLTINGNVDVNASAKNINNGSDYYYGYGYGGAEAEAFGAMSALGDVDITGDVSVAATSLSKGGYSNYYYPDGGEGDLSSLIGNTEDRIPGAEAWLTIIAGNNIDALHDEGIGEGPSVPADLNLTGNVTVTADARSDTGTWFNWLGGIGGGEPGFATQGIGHDGPGGFEGTYGYYTPAAAIGIMTATNDLTVTGDVNVSAYAQDTGGMMSGDSNGGEFRSLEPQLRYNSNTPVAISGLALVAGLDLTGNGGNGIEMPQGLSLDDEGYGGSHYEEGFFTEGDLTYTGDINVDADAIGRDDAWAIGAALLMAGGDVTINTDPVIVDANATIEGSYYLYGEGTAVALAGLVTVAGLNDFEEGYASLDIAEGDVRIDFRGEGDPHHLTVLGNLEANARTNVPTSSPGPVPLLAITDGGEGPESGYRGFAGALTALVATGDIDVKGNDPLASANPARAQEKQSAWQACEDGGCSPEFFGLFGWTGSGEASGETENPSDNSLSLAQLILAAGGDVSIVPKNRFLDVITPYEKPTPIPTGDPGNLPLRFAANGDMLVATGTGVTTPPSIEAMNLDIEDALAAGGDPTTLLAPTAAGPGSQEGLASGQDAYTTTGPDFCDKLVSGACLDGTPGEGTTQ